LIDTDETRRALRRSFSQDSLYIHIIIMYVCAQKKLRINTTDKRRSRRVFVCEAQSSGMKNISTAVGDRNSLYIIYYLYTSYYHGYRSTRRLYYIFYVRVRFDITYDVYYISRYMAGITN